MQTPGGGYRQVLVEAGLQLSESYPARPESVGRVRSALVRLAAALGANQDQVDAIKLAVSESVTNVVCHAYGRATGACQPTREVHVAAAVAEGELWILISDDGVGLHAQSTSSGLGMGLALIASVADYFELAKRSGGGTEVRMSFALTTRSSEPDDHRGDFTSATRPAAPRFSTTT
jgi:anti-sigma regulatory factor (Ser/Thr protein kinase)